MISLSLKHFFILTHLKYSFTNVRGPSQISLYQLFPMSIISVSSLLESILVIFILLLVSEQHNSKFIVHDAKILGYGQCRGEYFVL